MNDRQIKCFLEAARLLNFTRAAENLLLPQPAVSRYITALEKELDVRLFEREGSRKVTLTEEGRIYYNLFRRTGLELARTRQALSGASSPVIRVGINKSWNIADHLSRVEELCRKKEPGFQATYECLHFHELTAKLKENRLDAVLSMENYLAGTPQLTVERITSLRRLIVYSDRLPHHEQIQSPSDFYSFDFLLVDDPLIRRLAEESETIFQAYHFVPRFRTVPNQETVLFYVEKGAGVAFLDQWCYALHRPHMRYIYIDEYSPVALACRSGADLPSQELFRECLISYCKTLK